LPAARRRQLKARPRLKTHDFRVAARARAAAAPRQASHGRSREEKCQGARLLLLIGQAEQRGRQQRPPGAVPGRPGRGRQFASKAQRARDQVGVGVRQARLRARSRAVVKKCGIGSSSRAGKRAARARPPLGASAPARAARPQRDRPSARDSAERAAGERGAPAGRQSGHGAAGAARWSKRALLKIPPSPLALCGRGGRGAGGAGGGRTLSALTSSAGGGWMRPPAARSRPSSSSSAALRSFQFALRARSPADVFAGAQRGSHQRC